MNQYLALNDSKFINAELGELRQSLKQYNAKIRADMEHGIILINADATYGAVSNAISKSIYVSSIMEVSTVVNAARCGDMVSALAEIIGRHGNARFMLEVKRIGSTISDSAKAIEVCLGSALEAQGFKADLKTPEIKVGIVLAGSTAYMGILDSNMRLDYFRNSANAAFLNRAEYKIDEAFKFFGIKIRSGVVLDIGASPGGWTDFLLANGFNVIAIDGALLRYEKLKAHGSMAVVCRNGDSSAASSAEKSGANCISEDNDASIAECSKTCRLVHIKLPVCAESLRIIGLMPKFDAMFIDANTSPEQSASFMKSLLPFMKHGSLVVMTIKLIDYDISGHISSVTESIGSACSSVRIKKLPHNRRELTMLAELK
ncbi:MAG: THUMP domain-containing protein [Candidatus Marsarchaeota archaeon]|jgi:tRNA(Ser,Leu) C12 N-acetylase TAN1|nr:THUMP domain-containing protein [Candidatus Marsarchaeota archaeon]MCL5418686.1 THUMP domain-containing protein [Candidatus Marsarchaeota archaeon]